MLVAAESVEDIELAESTENRLGGCADIEEIGNVVRMRQKS